jgi:EpsI family protein
MPERIGRWTGKDVALSAEVLKVLGDGQFLTRVYRAPQEPKIDLYIAYYRSQRTGATIHSPLNCLPGAGWTPLAFSRIVIPGAGGPSMTVNRYIIGKGSDRQFVLYWYQAHGRIVASEYTAKFYLVSDSIRLNRSDGALVRVITPIQNGESPRLAELRAVDFAVQLDPLLDRYIPR